MTDEKSERQSCESRQSADYVAIRDFMPESTTKPARHPNGTRAELFPRMPRQFETGNTMDKLRSRLIIAIPSFLSVVLPRHPWESPVCGGVGRVFTRCTGGEHSVGQPFQADASAEK